MLQQNENLLNINSEAHTERKEFIFQDIYNELVRYGNLWDDDTENHRAEDELKKIFLCKFVPQEF